MVMVRIDEKLYEEIKPIVEKDRVEYPTLQNFVNKAVKHFIKKKGD